MGSRAPGVELRPTSSCLAWIFGCIVWFWVQQVCFKPGPAGSDITINCRTPNPDIPRAAGRGNARRLGPDAPRRGETTWGGARRGVARRGGQSGKGSRQIGAAQFGQRMTYLPFRPPETRKLPPRTCPWKNGQRKSLLNRMGEDNGRASQALRQRFNGRTAATLRPGC